MATDLRQSREVLGVFILVGPVEGKDEFGSRLARVNEVDDGRAVAVVALRLELCEGMVSQTSSNTGNDHRLTRSCLMAACTHCIVFVSVVASHRRTYGSNHAEKSMTSGSLNKGRRSALRSDGKREYTHSGQKALCIFCSSMTPRYSSSKSASSAAPSACEAAARRAPREASRCCTNQGPAIPMKMAGTSMFLRASA